MLGVPLLVLGLLGATVCLRLDMRARQEARTVAAEFRALAAARALRPSHVEHPTPGTFAQALEPLLPELHGLKEADLRMDAPECWDILWGHQPVTPLPPTCLERLEHFRPLMQRVLRASRTEEAGLPETLRLIAVHGAEQDGLLEPMLRDLIVLAALDVRLQAEGGQADRALEDCLDALALSRDLSHGAGQYGVSYTAHDYDVLFRPCAAALSRASPSGARQATLALRHLREGLRPLSAAIDESRVLDSLDELFELLGAAQVKDLPRPRSTGTDEAPWERIFAWFVPLFRKDAFLARLEDDRRLASLVDLPLSRRESPLAALEDAEKLARNPLRSTVAWSAIHVAVRADRQRMEVDLLLALALVRTWRAEHGQWPSSLPALYPEHPVLRPTALWMHSGAAETWVIEPREETVRELEAYIDPHEREGAMMDFTVTALP